MDYPTELQRNLDNYYYHRQKLEEAVANLKSLSQPVQAPTVKFSSENQQDASKSQPQFDAAGFSGPDVIGHRERIAVPCSFCPANGNCAVNGICDRYGNKVKF